MSDFNKSDPDDWDRDPVAIHLESRMHRDSSRCEDSSTVSSETGSKLISLITQHEMVVLTRKSLSEIVELTSEMAHLLMFPECDCNTKMKVSNVLAEAKMLHTGIEEVFTISDAEFFDNVHCHYRFTSADESRFAGVDLGE